MSELGKRLKAALVELLAQSEELEAAAVVSFDGLPMASALPPEMNEDRVAAMSAALLSLGEKAAQGLGRGDLNQVYVEGDSGTVFLVSAEDEAVLVAVAAAGAKAGLMLYEVRHAAKRIGAILTRPRNLEAVPADVVLDTSNVMAMPLVHESPVLVAPIPVPPVPVAPVHVPAVHVPAVSEPLVQPVPMPEPLVYPVPEPEPLVHQALLHEPLLHEPLVPVVPLPEVAPEAQPAPQVALEMSVPVAVDVPTAFPSGVAADLYGERRIEPTDYTPGVWR